jgi:hypothetical protein
MFGKFARRHTRSFRSFNSVYYADRYVLADEAERNQGTCHQKILNNIMWVNAAVENSKKTKKYKNLYIDGPDARTTRVLMDAGYASADCIAVNDDTDVVNVLQKLSTDARRATFKERINKPIDGLNAVWHDGCGTMKGTKQTSLIRDIEELLVKHNLDNTILAITFCTRDNRGISKSKAINKLSDTITHHGYVMDMIAEVQYPTAMCFWMARLKHEDMPLL